MIEIEKEARWADKRSAKMLEGDAVQYQRVFEASKAEENKASIREIVQQMDQKFNRLNAELTASMAEFNKRLAEATEIAAEMDSRGSPTAAMSATAMTTHMQCVVRLR